MDAHTLNKHVIVLILILFCLVGTVQADATHPPASVKIAGYISTHNQIGVWWVTPANADFIGTKVWLDNVYITEYIDSTKFTYFEFLSLGAHTISTKTVDLFGNVNATWVNVTINNDGFFACNEAWYCTSLEWCGIETPTVIPTTVPIGTTVTVTPTAWVNVTKKPTDICTVQADMGETWVKWDAVCNTSVEVMYYIDGKPLANVAPYQKLNPDRLILSDLNGMETHNLKIYYLDEVIVDSTITTLPEWYMLLFFIVLSVVLSIIALLFIVSPVGRIVLAGLAFSIALWMMTLVTGWMIAVPVAPAIFAGLVIILALRDLIAPAWES